MRAYSQMPSEEFVQQLRDSAIQNGCGPLIIDQIDKLGCESDQSERIQELEADIENLEEEVNDLKAEIVRLEGA